MGRCQGLSTQSLRPAARASPGPPSSGRGHALHELALLASSGRRPPARGPPRPLCAQSRRPPPRSPPRQPRCACAASRGATNAAQLSKQSAERRPAQPPGPAAAASRPCPPRTRPRAGRPPPLRAGATAAGPLQPRGNAAKQQATRLLRLTSAHHESILRRASLPPAPLRARQGRAAAGCSRQRQQRTAPRELAFQPAKAPRCSSTESPGERIPPTGSPPRAGSAALRQQRAWVLQLQPTKKN
jgi:hypothetical protein